MGKPPKSGKVEFVLPNLARITCFLPKKVYATLKFKQTKTSQNRNNQDIFLEIEFFKKIK